MIVDVELKQRRLLLNFTQAKLASALGVTPTAVAYWERGERKPATPQMLDMALSWLESQQNKSERHKNLMKIFNENIESSRIALTRKKS